jgi:hypothetical protein
MSGDPLRDLDRAARIHVFGNARRTEAVTTPASTRSDDPGVSIQSFHDSCRRTETVEHSDLTLGASVPAKDRPLL